MFYYTMWPYLFHIIIFIALFQLSLADDNTTKDCMDFLSDPTTKAKENAEKLQPVITTCIWHAFNDELVQNKKKELNSYDNVYQRRLLTVAPMSVSDIALYNLTIRRVLRRPGKTLINIAITYDWFDERLEGLTKYGNLLYTDKFVGSCEETWCPNLTIRSVGDETKELKPGKLVAKVSKPGIVRTTTNAWYYMSCNRAIKNYPFDVLKCCFTIVPDQHGYFKASSMKNIKLSSTNYNWRTIVNNFRGELVTLSSSVNQYDLCFDIRRKATLFGVSVLFPTLSGFLLFIVSPFVGNMANQLQFKLVSMVLQFMAIIIFIQCGAGRDFGDSSYSMHGIPNIDKLFEGSIIITVIGILLTIVLFPVLQRSPLIKLSMLFKPMTQIVLKFVRFVEGPVEVDVCDKSDIDPTSSNGVNGNDGNDLNQYRAFLKMINTLSALILGALFLAIWVILFPKPN